MQEKKTKIATNTSSGAEKVEVIKEKVKRTKNADADKVNKEKKAAEKRVQVALQEQKAKQKQDEKKKLTKEEQAAQRRALKEARRAKRKALHDQRVAAYKRKLAARKQQAEERQRARAHAKATKRQEAARAKARREEKRKQRRSDGRRSNTGWIATVAVLGATTLGLTTAVALGAMEMNKARAGMHAGYRSTAYELVGIMEHVDDDLDRVRIAVTPEQQARILTDLLVQTRLAELDLEKLPISAQDNENVTVFINRAGQAFERMLAKLRNGERLSEDDQELLERLYVMSGKIKTEMEGFIDGMSDDMVKEFLKDGKGKITDMLRGLEDMTLEENTNLMERAKTKMKGAGMGRNQEMDTPHADQEAKIDVAKAEELCKTYFSDYAITEYQCIGETVTKDVKAYNVQGYDTNGTLLFAEIDYMTGALVRFDYFEDCNEETFDNQNAERIAGQFLQKLGYENMQAMRVSQNGTDADFMFVYTLDDVAFYPDTVKVKVCRTRGVVTSFDASKYLRRHQTREVPSVSLSLSDAQNRLHEGLDVRFARLTVVDTQRGERPAYEFLCGYGENSYLIYTDAKTGAEIAIINVKNAG